MTNGKPKCAVDGCERKPVARGWCPHHYNKWNRHGDPLHRLNGEIRNGCKVCNRCRRDLPLSAFAPDRTRSGGVSGRCRECDSAVQVEYRKRNPGKVAETQRRYAEANREKRREYALRYIAERRDEMRAKTRAYWAANPDRARDHVARRRAQKRATEVEPIQRTDIFERDGWTCQLCNEPMDPAAVWPQPLFATIDHIMPLSLGGTHTADNLQAAHLACNLRKGAQPVNP